MVGIVIKDSLRTHIPTYLTQIILLPVLPTSLRHKIDSFSPSVNDPADDEREGIPWVGEDRRPDDDNTPGMRIIS